MFAILVVEIEAGLVWHLMIQQQGLSPFLAAPLSRLLCVGDGGRPVVDRAAAMRPPLVLLNARTVQCQPGRCLLLQALLQLTSSALLLLVSFSSA